MLEGNNLNQLTDYHLPMTMVKTPNGRIPYLEWCQGEVDRINGNDGVFIRDYPARLDYRANCVCVLLEDSKCIA